MSEGRPAVNNCCLLAFAIKGFREGFAIAPLGARMTCPRCGQSWKKAARWEPVRTADEILDMMAEERTRMMTDDLFVTTLAAPDRGVVLLPPPLPFREAINADILRTAREQLRPESAGGLVGTATRVDGRTSVNLAVVHRVGEAFTIGAYIGKTWGTPIAGGGSVKWEW